MIEITFKEFHEHEFIEEGFELHVMKNGFGDVLYVGISLEWNIQQNFTIKFLEPFMIRKLCPILNLTYNSNPGKDRMPKSEREKRRGNELDKGYYNIFENKEKNNG